MSLFRETADVSVRPAVPGDDVAMTAIQVGAWRSSHADVLGDDVLDALDTVRMREQWAAAISSPPGPGFAVLVACAGPTSWVSPRSRPARSSRFEVEPRHQRGGHGSRLLAAAVDRLRRDGADEVVTWVLDGDAAREAFLSGSGLGPDGRTRTLATGLRDVVERRWTAEI